MTRNLAPFCRRKFKFFRNARALRGSRISREAAGDESYPKTGSYRRTGSAPVNPETFLSAPKMHSPENSSCDVCVPLIRSLYKS